MQYTQWNMQTVRVHMLRSHYQVSVKSIEQAINIYHSYKAIRPKASVVTLTSMGIVWSRNKIR